MYNLSLEKPTRKLPRVSARSLNGNFQMNETEEYILESIKKWIWSGFYSQSDVREMIYDILEKDCDEEMLLSKIEPEMRL